MANIKNKLKVINLSDIKPYKRNAKIHTPEQIELLKNSIKKNDYIEPIIVGTNNTIVGGHGRYDALMQIDPNQKIEVVDVSYLSVRQQKKLRILLNKSSSEEYDKEKLKAEIESIYTDLQSDFLSINEELGIYKKELESMINDLSDQKDLSDTMKSQFEVVIECTSEKHQQKVYNKINQMGYKCRVLTL